jgi:Leucine-rich repeat (LRR) protein
LTTNQLSAFPTQLCSLTGLQTLGLQNNLIPDVPDNIGTRTSLVALYLAQNPIKKLPLTIGLLSSLVCLTIDREGVDLQVPEWAIDGDTRTLRDYYSHLLNTK